jgi:hypothetical protein
LRFDPQVREDAVVDDEALASVPFFSTLCEAAMRERWASPIS